MGEWVSEGKSVREGGMGEAKNLEPTNDPTYQRRPKSVDRVNCSEPLHSSIASRRESWNLVCDLLIHNNNNDFRHRK